MKQNGPLLFQDFGFNNRQNVFSNGLNSNYVFSRNDQQAPPGPPPTILTLPRVTATPPNSPVGPARTRTPVPADSPLLSKVRQDPILKRFRSFNRSLKKASSFRQARDRAADLV